jgi:opacity protein-like surface antigen
LYLNQFRLEFQYTAQYNKINALNAFGMDVPGFTGSFHSNLFMLNAYYDQPLTDRLSAYVGGGLGDAYVAFGGDSANWQISHQTGNAFAYQVMAGLEYQLTPFMSVFGGYRGWSANNINAQNSNIAIPWSNIVEIGLRVSL